MFTFIDGAAIPLLRERNSFLAESS
jgi:hypothetical protein